MSDQDPEELRAKVDEFLRNALAETDLEARAKLLGKAVHWTNVAKKSSALHSDLR